MSSIREIITLSIVAGLGLAIILNASNAVTIVNAVSNAWTDLISTVSGQNA